MALNDGLRRYLEAGVSLTQITRARAEELVRDLVRAGAVEAERAQDWAEDLVRRSRERSEALVGTVRAEVRQQLAELGFTSVEDLAKRVADIVNRAQAQLPARRRTPARPPAASTRTAPARKATAHKATAHKATARKAPARTAGTKAAARATTTAPARKAAARKAPARKAQG